MYKRKDGRWQQMVRINGERRYFAGKTQAEVLQKIREAKDHAPDRTLFRSVAEEFEEWRFEQLAPGSLSCYRPALRNAVERFGDRQISQIKPKDVSMYLSDLSHRYAAKTVSNYRSMLSQVFSYAINQMGLDIADPCVSVKTPPSKIKAEIRQPLTPAQRAEVDSTRPDEFILAFLIVNTGARLGEACALQWKDVDFDRNEIYIKKSLHWDGNRPYAGELKTKNADRVVPLLDPLRDMLLEIGPKPDSWYLVSGKKMLTMSQLESRWTQWCIDHNLAHPEDKTWKTHGEARRHLKWICEINRHQIRHDYATSLFRAGIPVKTVQHLLGHSDYSTTMDIYVHFQKENVETARVQMNEFLRSQCAEGVRNGSNR